MKECLFMPIPSSLSSKVKYPLNFSFSNSDYVQFNDIVKFLEEISEFEEPKVTLEQYSLPNEIIAFILLISKNELFNRNIVDLGCGTGRLSLPMAKFFSKRVLGVDSDISVVIQMLKAMKRLKVRTDVLISPVEFIETDNWGRMFPITIMNPPFGTKRRGIDQVFLKKALIFSDVVLSIHKSSKASRKLWKDIATSFNKKATILATFEFDIMRSFYFHKQEKHAVEVDLIIFSEF
jgi:putative methylase